MSYGGKNFNQCHHRAIAWTDVKHLLQSVKGFYLCPFLCCEVIVTPLSEIRSSQSYCRRYYNLWCFIDVFLLHQRGWLCRRHRWTHRRIVSQCESNATTELMPGELWHIRVCVCDGVFERESNSWKCRSWCSSLINSPCFCSWVVFCVFLIHSLICPV